MDEQGQRASQKGVRRDRRVEARHDRDKLVYLCGLVDTLKSLRGAPEAQWESLSRKVGERKCAQAEGVKVVLRPRKCRRSVLIEKLGGD
jgi:hypothetical protein